MGVEGQRRVKSGSSGRTSRGPESRGGSAGPSADGAPPVEDAPPADGAPPGAPQAAVHRSGAVARMLGMPVATLRVWERRYALTRTPASAGGQRRYTAADVHRLMLLRQLTGLGHAIGSLAALDPAQLRRVAATDARTRAGVRAGVPADALPEAVGRPWRLAVVGRALARRLERPALLRRLGRPVQLLGPYTDAPQAEAALAGGDAGGAADAWLLHEPQLHPGWLQALHERVPRLSGLPLGVVFGYAAEPVCEALADRGVMLLREPQPDAVLAQWLRQWADRASAAGREAQAGAIGAVDDPVPPRRWDDAALADFASRAGIVACECPRHVAELLVQLSGFEVYSAQCARRSPADAALHDRLGRVAALARSGFEAALAQLAMHEGLALPPSARSPEAP